MQGTPRAAGAQEATTGGWAAPQPTPVPLAGGEEGVWLPGARANPADYFMKLLRIDMGKGAKGAENTVAQLRMVCRLLPSWAPLECRDRIPEGEGCYPERCCP